MHPPIFALARTTGFLGRHAWRYGTCMKPDTTQTIVFWIFRILTVVVVVLLLGVVGYVFVRGIGAVTNLEFWTDMPRNGLVEGGIMPAIVGTLVLTLVSIFAAVAIGVPAGVYMSEYAKHGRLKSTIDIMTNNLAGVPSIVFGLFGMSVFVIGLGMGDSILAGALTLAIMVLPVIIRTTEQALFDVPQGIRQASLALGATKFQTIVRVVLPMALPRVLTGVILSVGRVAGETAPILFTVAALYLPTLPTSLTDQVMALPYHLYILSVSSPDPARSMPMAFGTALVLLLIVLVINLATNLIRRRFDRQYKAH
jgi:phosphate transport system permease protein